MKDECIANLLLHFELQGLLDSLLLPFFVGNTQQAGVFIHVRGYIFLSTYMPVNTH